MPSLPQPPAPGRHPAPGEGDARADTGATPDAWLAEAAMHRILRRTLPAQRHDVLGALSALKLQLAVARRRAARADDAAAEAASPTADAGAAPSAALAHLEAMAEQHLAAQAGLVALRLWDGLQPQRRGAQAVIRQCLAWVRQAAAMRGHQLEELAELAGSASAPPAQAAGHGDLVEVPAAHYLVLALLFATLDPLPQPCRITPRCEPLADGWRLLLQVHPRPAHEAMPPPPAPDAAAPARPVGQAQPSIDLPMLQALARQCSGNAGSWRAWCASGAAGGGTVAELVFTRPA